MPKREGELELPRDPAHMAADAHLVFIGHVRSPWKSRDTCPKNMSEARKTGLDASIELLPDFRPGLAGLAGASHIIVLTWFDMQRNLIVQKPRHLAVPKGVFALRSPLRPNPVGVHVARLLALDTQNGILSLDAFDALDGTPVVDVKPYFASVDAFPDATRPDAARPGT